MRKIASTESQIHEAIVAHLERCGASGLVYFHPANGGKRNVREAVKLKRMGVRAGVSDLILVHKGIVYALEIKSEKGRSTEAQVQFCIDVIDAGGFAYVAYGLDAALGALRTWGLIDEPS